MDLFLTGLFCLLNHAVYPGSQLIGNRYVMQDTSLPFFQDTVNYHVDTLKGKTAVADFNARYPEEEKEIILAINRISSSQVQKGKILVIPDSLSSDILNYSPYPDSLPVFDTLPKLILIGRRIQAFAIYEYGRLSRWGPVSSGKKTTPTPAGLFHTNFKAVLKVSSEDDSWIMPWYFNFYARRGIAMHQYLLPGYPASHACVRMQEKDAKWIFDWADQWKVSAKNGAVINPGTPVIIFGDYNYGTTAPWKKLPTDKQATILTLAEWEEIVAYLPVINTDVVLRK